MFATMRDLPYRIMLTLVNIFFPPLAVMMMTGLGPDTALNCLLFLLAVIPSHVHGFYISWVYFSRRRRVRKGRYPGGPKSLITSKDVVNGGLTDGEVARLYRQEKRIDRKGSGKSKSRSRSRSRGRSIRDMVQRRPSTRTSSRAGAADHIGRQGSRHGRVEPQRNGTSGGRERDFERGRRWAQQVAQDGYGPVYVAGSSADGSAVSGPGRW